MGLISLNQIKCKRCGDIIKSESEHDFKMCKCGACGVDGGLDYLRRLGNLEDFEEMSVVYTSNWNGKLDEKDNM